MASECSSSSAETILLEDYCFANEIPVPLKKYSAFPRFPGEYYSNISFSLFVHCLDVV